jgi:hypothetical protein
LNKNKNKHKRKETKKKTEKRKKKKEKTETETENEKKVKMGQAQYRTRVRHRPGRCIGFPQTQSYSGGGDSERRRASPRYGERRQWSLVHERWRGEGGVDAST